MNNFERWNKFFMAFGSVCNMLRGKVELEDIGMVFKEVKKQVDILADGFDSKPIVKPVTKKSNQEAKDEAIIEIGNDLF